MQTMTFFQTNVYFRRYMTYTISARCKTHQTKKNISLRMRACCISPNHPLSAISLNHNYTCLFPPMKTSFSRSDTFASRSLTRMALPTCSKLCPRVIVKYSTSLAITSIFVLSEQNTEIAQNAINFINLQYLHKS